MTKSTPHSNLEPPAAAQPAKCWVIYNADYGQFWGPNSGGYFGLWGAGLYTEAEARSLANNKDRRDHVHHVSEYRDQIANMRGAFERLSAALGAVAPAAALSPTRDEFPKLGTRSQWCIVGSHGGCDGTDGAFANKKPCECRCHVESAALSPTCAKCGEDVSMFHACFPKLRDDETSEPDESKQCGARQSPDGWALECTRTAGHQKGLHIAHGTAGEVIGAWTWTIPAFPKSAALSPSEEPASRLRFVLAELSMLATRSTVTPGGLVPSERGPWMVVYQPEWERIFNREASAPLSPAAQEKSK